MPQTPKAWQDFPNQSTPINAASLVDMEVRLGNYFDQFRSSEVSTLPRILAGGSGGPSSGNAYAFPAFVRTAGTYTGIRMGVVTQFAGLTSARVGVYTDDGTAAGNPVTLIAQTADVSAALNAVTANNLFTAALSSNAVLTANQKVWLSFMGVGFSAGALRGGTLGTGTQASINPFLDRMQSGYTGTGTALNGTFTPTGGLITSAIFWIELT